MTALLMSILMTKFSPRGTVRGAAIVIFVLEAAAAGEVEFSGLVAGALVVAEGLVVEEEAGGVVEEAGAVVEEDGLGVGEVAVGEGVVGVVEAEAVGVGVGAAVTATVAGVPAGVVFVLELSVKLIAGRVKLPCVPELPIAVKTILARDPVPLTGESTLPLRVILPGVPAGEKAQLTTCASTVPILPGFTPLPPSAPVTLNTAAL